MVRPRIPRRIRFCPRVRYFKPRGIPLRALSEIPLNPDEVETIRLADLNELDQTEAAKKMKISQSTFQRILTSAHKKIAQALVQGKAIRISR